MVKHRCAVFLAVGWLLLLAGCAQPPGMSRKPSPSISSVRLPAEWTLTFGKFSPTEDRIAVIADDEHLIPRVSLVGNGDPVPMTGPRKEAMDFAWLSTNELVVALRDGARSVFVVLDTEANLLGTIAPENPLRSEGTGMVASPDGESLLVSSMAPGGDLISQTDLVAVSLSSGRTSRVTDTPSLFETSPVFLDDETIAFVRGSPESTTNSIVIMHLDTGQETVLATSSLDPGSITASVGGRYLYFDALELAGNFESRSLWSIPVAGGEPTQVADTNVTYPSVRADGRAVLASDVSDGVHPGLVMISLPA